MATGAPRGTTAAAMKSFGVLLSILSVVIGGVSAASWRQPQFPAPRFGGSHTSSKAATAASSSSSSSALRGTDSSSSAALPYTQKTFWFSQQRIDHFSMVDRRTWSQRYFVIDDYWKGPSGPVVLHICGEYTCPGIMPERLFPLVVAKQFGALVVSVEHRFFGKSQPFGNLSSNLLPYLNSRQAINDLAYFTQWFQQTHINTPYGLPNSTFNKFIPVGGSYPGGLSAMYRIKFPHLSVGAHSSSGVINAKVAFPQFDEQVATTAGPDCANALRQITHEIEEQLPSIKTAFKASNLDDGDFFYLVADAAAEAMQYGHHEVVCDAVTKPFLAGRSPLPAFINYTLNFFYGSMGNSASDYDTNLLIDPVHGGNGRSWWWMKCTELGWWQVAPAKNSIRSQRVNVAYHQNVCRKVFGVTQLPDVAATNNYYGGAKPAGTNIFFANGVEDPWQWASVRETLSPMEQAEVIDCNDCAHCVDLYTPTESDPVALKNERARLLKLYGQWLS